MESHFHLKTSPNQVDLLKYSNWLSLHVLFLRKTYCQIMALYSIIFFILVILFPPREPLVLPVSHCYFESENISALLLKPTKTYDLTQ
jgi:hypothetical protein